VSQAHIDPAEQLGDFTATARIVPVAALAIGIGVVSAFVAKLLLTLIDVTDGNGSFA
jgi:hypothetical protein